MKIDYDNIFWVDSSIEKVTVKYDKIAVKFFNDVLQEYIVADCKNCLGMTRYIACGETIVENVFVNIVSPENNSLYKEANDICKRNFPEEQIEFLNKTYYELRVVLIDKTEFSIVCQELEFNVEK